MGGILAFMVSTCGWESSYKLADASGGSSPPTDNDNGDGPTVKAFWPGFFMYYMALGDDFRSGYGWALALLGLLLLFNGFRILRATAYVSSFAAGCLLAYGIIMTASGDINKWWGFVVPLVSGLVGGAFGLRHYRVGNFFTGAGYGSVLALMAHGIVIWALGGDPLLRYTWQAWPTHDYAWLLFVYVGAATRFPRAR